jgi:repressor LexA
MEALMTLGEILKKLRKEKGLTQISFAEQFQISYGTIAMWETNKRQPDNTTLMRLADFFGVSIDYLLGREEIKNPANVYDVNGLLSFEVLGVVRAGYNGLVNEIPTGEIIELPSSMISGEHKDDYFVLQVKGNSMYPRLLDGDKILCKRMNSVDSGSLAVVLYDGEDATVKRVNYVVGEEWLELVPYNPEYETKRIEGADLEICRILGKVVKLIRDL